MKVKLNLSNFNNDFQSDSEITNLNSISDSLIPMGKSGIHIKKENRGKFTDYCGGKVTDACIKKAKASGNPKLIKRATFAANARKWKHQQGGPINYKRWDNAKITSYTIPFIKEKAIKLTNVGKATGAKLSTNLLDSIADNAYRAKLPIRKALGIAFKESTFGNPTDDKSAWNLSSKIRKQFNNEYPGTYQHINNGHTVLGQHLINYHKGDTNHEVFYEGNPDAHKSIIQEAFEFYKQHPDKYNSGQKNYQQLIDKLGDEAMQSPEIQKWYREWGKSKVQIFRPEPYKINTNIQNTAQEFIPHKNKEANK